MEITFGNKVHNENILVGNIFNKYFQENLGEPYFSINN
jgi:hypothetical protein